MVSTTYSQCHKFSQAVAAKACISSIGVKPRFISVMFVHYFAQQGTIPLTKLHEALDTWPDRLLTGRGATPPTLAKKDTDKA